MFLNSIVKVFSTVGIRAFKYTWYKRFFQKRSKRINVWSHKSSIFTFRLKETNSILFEYPVGYSTRWNKLIRGDRNEVQIDTMC